MKSLKGRLLTTFLGVIFVLALSSLALFFINWRAVEEYRSIVDTMIAEYRLVQDASTLIEAFNVQIQSAGTDVSSSEAQIAGAKAEITRLTAFLDQNISDSRLRSNYLGFKASIESLVQKIESSLQKSASGNIEDYFTDFNEVNRQYGFVRENGTTLIYSQLQYFNEVQQKISETYFWSTLLGVSTLLILLLGCILFVLQFARKLAEPLKALTVASQDLAKGNMEVSMGTHILQEVDEVRTLARSFQHMTEKLKATQENLRKKAEESEGRAVELAEKLSEIERMNKLMVNRELKMVELKEEVSELKEQLQEEQKG